MEAALAMPDTASLYRALVTRDARLDGAVFYGIASTGIYCRPVCPARTPKFENCRFFPSAAAAQGAGFRPCLRCRPETAPHCAAWRGTSTTVTRSLALIEEGALDGPNATVEALADRVGVGERQLRRLFLQHLGASPIAVAQTRRVLFAKQLLHDTRLPMLAVAEAAGFGSERRFHEVFQTVFKRPPSAIRRAATADLPASGDEVLLRIRYRPPYDWHGMLRALSTRCMEGVDEVIADVYQRRIRNGHRTGSVHVTHDEKRNSLIVRVQAIELRDLPTTLSRVRRLFDTGADILRIGEDLSCDTMLRPLVQRYPGLRVPGEWETSSDHAAGLHDWHADSSDHLLRIVSRLEPAVTTHAALDLRSQAWRPWRAYAERLLLRTGEETSCSSK